MQEAVSSTMCVACHHTALEFFGKRLAYEYFKCPQCSVVQLHPQPTKEELMLAYEKEYASANHYQGDPVELTEAAMSYYMSVLEAVQSYGIKGRILDYGAGWGGMCQLFNEQGYQCSGLEIAEDMVAYCQENNIPVEKGDLSVLDPVTTKYDTMVLCTVFEHLIEHDIFLQEAYAVLEDEGYLITLQPTASFAEFMGNVMRFNDSQKELPQLHQVFAPPWHTAFFSNDGMKALAERNGFELVETRPAPQGRRKGLLGMAQITLENINKVGTTLFGDNWKLVVAHVFILRKTK